jgi:ATP-dependent Clp protease ATP-binding subunit ClpA
VLLLDEFEKTDRKVLDLFLQILDEGIFSDVQGRRVSARNLIVIATSNAGSQNIFETVQAGKDLASSKDAIIESIVREGIYKPELLNRFDGVILFHPLTESDLKEVAKIMLKRLEWRLKERNITLVVNDALVQFLVKKGSDPKFGARPLNRAIQDTVEKIIADRIIAGTLTPGSSLELTDADLV